MSKLEFGTWREAGVAPDKRVLTRPVSYTASDSPNTLLFGQHEKVLQEVDGIVRPVNFKETIQIERNGVRRTIDLQFGDDGKLAHTSIELAGATKLGGYSIKVNREHPDGVFEVVSTCATINGRLATTHNLETGRLSFVSFIPKHENPAEPGLEYDFYYNGDSVSPSITERGKTNNFDDLPHGQYFEHGEYSFNFSRADRGGVILGIYDKVSKTPDFRMFFRRIQPELVVGSMKKVDTWKWGLGVIAELRPNTPKMDATLERLTQAIIKYGENR